MISVLTGSNDYARRLASRQLRADFSGEAEQYDGPELTREQLLDLTQGTTLFSNERLIIITNLSANKSLWPELDTLLGKVSNSTHLVLNEAELDKRSKAYKWLQKNADMRVFEEWTRRDEHKAIAWCETEAKSRGIALGKPLATMLVKRAGVKQWRLAAALDNLELVESVTPEVIEQSIEPQLEENVFELFGATLSGDTAKVETMLSVLAQTDDAYRVLALISSQAVQFASLLTGGKPMNEVASDIKASPYVLGKLASYTSGKTHQDVAKILNILARADRQMKSTGSDPWAIVASALLTLQKSA